MSNSAEEKEEQEVKLREQAFKFGLQEITDLSTLSLDKEWYKKIPYAFARKHLLLPLEINEQGALIVAVNDSLNLFPLEELHWMLDLEIKPVYAPEALILQGLHHCYHQKAEETSQAIRSLSSQGGQGEEEVEVYDLLDEQKGTSPVIKILNLILLEAIQQESSDIHFDPTEEGLRIRYRIDGVLQDRHSPAKEHQAALLSRIKVMSKLDIAEHRLPQDGRIKLRMGGREIDFRVSTLPVVNGERVVLRILDKGNVVLGLDQLQMPDHILTNFQKHIRIPEGVVLVTGPTGSGKTTTLYSAILAIRSGSTNIMTIEDPVEYKFPGIAQIAVRPKIDLTFAKGLRSILRQDPDIIMIGEIRDKETAEIAIQAALTGHLVLSTLHTNDAPSAVTRLVDMGIEPYLLASSLVGVLAQRLVRKICSNCKEFYQPPVEMLEELNLKADAVPKDGFARGKGCKSCFDSGYKGRQGVYEYMPLTPKIKQQVVETPDAVKLRQIAMKEGLQGLRENGIRLICKGVTTVEEVLRVTRGIELQ